MILFYSALSLDDRLTDSELIHSVTKSHEILPDRIISNFFNCRLGIG